MAQYTTKHGCSEIVENGRFVGFACNPTRGRKPKCHYCFRSVERTCDFKLESGRKCNYPICNECSIYTEPNIDFCKSHYEPPVFDLSRGREYEAKYQSICFNPNCRRRVELGEMIRWFGTGKVLCAKCVEKYEEINQKGEIENVS
jgi:hypothetical protein